MKFLLESDWLKIAIITRKNTCQKGTFSQSLITTKIEDFH